MRSFPYFLIFLIIAYPLVQRVNLDRIRLKYGRDIILPYTTIFRYLLLGYIVVFFPELNRPAVASFPHGPAPFPVENYYVGSILYRAGYFTILISVQRVVELALYRKIANTKVATVAKAIVGGALFSVYAAWYAPHYGFFAEYVFYPMFGVINSLTNTWFLVKTENREPVRISRIAKYCSILLLPMVLVINYPKLRREIHSSYYFPSCSLSLARIDFFVEGYDWLAEDVPTSMDSFMDEVMYEPYFNLLKCPYSDDDQKISYEYFNPRNLKDEAKGERFILLYEKPNNGAYCDGEGGEEDCLYERSALFNDGNHLRGTEEEIHELLLKQSKSPDAFIWEPSSRGRNPIWVRMQEERFEGARRRAVTPIGISFLVFIAAGIFTYWPRPKNDELSESELKKAI